MAVRPAGRRAPAACCGNLMARPSRPV
jgi:hypothetical protein